MVNSNDKKFDKNELKDMLSNLKDNLETVDLKLKINRLKKTIIPLENELALKLTKAQIKSSEKDRENTLNRIKEVKRLIKNG